jgi:hypothetical protein
VVNVRGNESALVAVVPPVLPQAAINATVRATAKDLMTLNLDTGTSSFLTRKKEGLAGRCLLTTLPTRAASSV